MQYFILPRDRRSFVESDIYKQKKCAMPYGGKWESLIRPVTYNLKSLFLMSLPYPPEAQMDNLHSQ